MTDREWDDCPYSDWMINPLHEWGHANGTVPLPRCGQKNEVLARWLDRKLTLFAVACCRHRWGLFTKRAYRDAVEQVEQLDLEGRLADRPTRSSLYDEIEALLSEATAGAEPVIADFALRLLGSRGMPTATSAIMLLGTATGWDDFRSVTAAQAPLLRCIVGYPFRPVRLDPLWRTPTVVALARGIYDEHAFDRLPILADALQDAGCKHPDVLAHCRDTGPHARGCWVVDQILGKDDSGAELQQSG